MTGLNLDMGFVFLAAIYVVGMLDAWPAMSRRALRHDLDRLSAENRAYGFPTPTVGTADYIIAAFGGSMLAAVWPIWGLGLTLGWIGKLVGCWLFPDLRAGCADD